MLHHYTNVMSSTRPNVKNANVSGSILSHAERHELQKLNVRLEKNVHGNFSASVWKYFGDLCYNDNDKNMCIDKKSRYCLLCLQREQQLYNNDNKSGHISRIKKYSKTTSTCSLADHLLTVHELDVRNVSSTNTSGGNIKRQLSIEKSLAAAAGKHASPATSQHEFNRDLCHMICTDLLPFSMVSGVGVQNFFAKNFPYVHLPSESTLSTTALYDLYRGLKSDVKKLLAEVITDHGAFCLMFDGWSDKYFSRSYLGLRVAFIHPTSWRSHVKTLSVKVLDSHTGQSLANHIQKELDDFGIGDRRKCTLSSTHDGAANMMKCSRLLQIENVVHCVAHSVHLLLTVDSVNRIPDFVDLIKKCKEIVNVLHFKSCLVEEESLSEHDRETMNELIDKIHKAMDIVSLDERFSESLSVDGDDDSGNAKDMLKEFHNNTSKNIHVHRSLKREIPTR